MSFSLPCQQSCQDCLSKTSYSCSSSLLWEEIYILIREYYFQKKINVAHLERFPYFVMSECLLCKIIHIIKGFFFKNVYLLQVILHPQNKRLILVQERLDVQCGFNNKHTVHVCKYRCFLLFYLVYWKVKQKCSERLLEVFTGVQWIEKQL